VSGEYYRLLWKRAERFLLRALRDFEEGDYDGACFNAEEAIQLAAKALLYRFFGEAPRIHGSKTLLARLRNLLMDGGRDDVATIVGASWLITAMLSIFWRRATSWLATGLLSTVRSRVG